MSFFLLAASADYLSVQWLQARDGKHVFRAAALSMVLEALTWLPVWAAVTLGDWRVAGASIAGAGLGCAVALSRNENGPPPKE